MSVLLPILASQALALPKPHRIDNAVSPRQYELYNKRYIETHYVTLRCHLSVVVLRICEIRDAQRQTSENVFLIYKTARLPLAELTCGAAKIVIIIVKQKFLPHFLFYRQKSRYTEVWRIYRFGEKTAGKEQKSLVDSEKRLIFAPDRIRHASHRTAN